MSRRSSRGESGQSMIEFGLVLTALLLGTIGLIDVGRGIYAYNAVAAAARYGARWGSVVGGMCQGSIALGSSSGDWCNQQSSSAASGLGFWQQPGNYPKSASGCPATADTATSYAVSEFLPPITSNSSTIVGAVGQHFDSSASSSNVIDGLLNPGLDTSQLRVCIEMLSSYRNGVLSVSRGDSIKVVVYYPFTPAGPLFGSTTMRLVASSTYEIENT